MKEGSLTRRERVSLGVYERLEGWNKGESRNERLQSTWELIPESD